MYITRELFQGFQSVLTKLVCNNKKVAETRTEKEKMPFNNSSKGFNDFLSSFQAGSSAFAWR